MKKKLITFILAILLSAGVSGCAGTVPENADGEFYEESGTQAEESTNATEPDDTVLTDEDEQVPDLTFADLAERQFEFCSGAGAWAEQFTIERDGFFTGNFYDSNMGDTGEGYEAGTCYSSSYTGHFTNLTKINEYTYTMELADITYKEPVGTEEISNVDQVKYIYTRSYCLGETDTFTIYLPGTPLTELSEDVLIWIRYANESEEELTMITIVDESNGFGIYSMERLEPLEDAQMTYNSYKHSYDFYNELLTEAVTTADMVEYTGTMYEFSDECLNYIWRLIRYNTEEERYNEILTEQREWIAEKEAKAEEACAEFEGGSIATVAYNQTLADMTIKRCEELIGYLE